MPPNRATLVLMAIGFAVAACSREPLHGDTDFQTARKGFERELTVDQRKSVIEKMQAETAGKAGGS